MNKQKELSRFIKNETRKLGFSFCGIVKAEALTNHSEKLKEWLDSGYNAEMDYMSRNQDKRIDPGLLVDGAKSIVVVGYNYYQDAVDFEAAPKFSRYAFGEDYHKIIKDKLYELFGSIKAEVDSVSGRVFVDSAPVLERAWAERAGLGWIGKNSMFINKINGSFFFLAELIIDLDLEYDNDKYKDYCGSCTKCIDACPTKAITNNRTINSSKCLSYLTIEKRGDFAQSETQSLHGNVFGCDICQDVCPWNKELKITSDEAFSVIPEIKEYTVDDWKKITEDEFNAIFRNSPVLRTGYKGFIRNLKFL